MKNQIGIFVGYSLFFFLISTVLAGDFSLQTLILCAVISCISSLVTLKLFKVPAKIGITVIKMCRFLFFLIFSIYESAFTTLFVYAKRKGKIPTDIETLPLKTQSGTYRLFICQAITLTPGTVSVKSKAGSVDVLKIKTVPMDGAKKFDAILGKKS